MVQDKIPDSGGIEEELEQPAKKPQHPKPSTKASESLPGLRLELLRALLGDLPPITAGDGKGPLASIGKESDWWELSSLDDVELAARILVLTAHDERIKDRKHYGRKAFNLIVAWLTVVLFVVVCSAVSLSLPGWYPSWLLPVLQQFSLSDTVLVTLIGSTTANLIGLLVIVFKYVFSDTRRDAE